MSTTAGTPVKSCINTRAGLNGMSLFEAVGSTEAAFQCFLSLRQNIKVPDGILQQNPDGKGQLTYTISLRFQFRQAIISEGAIFVVNHLFI
jgi:hypothetical protein